MARIVMQFTCEGGKSGMDIYLDGEDIVFEMIPFDYDEDPYGSGCARMPLEEFRDKLDRLIAAGSK